jgi:hypothetical protein
MLSKRTRDDTHDEAPEADDKERRARHPLVVGP